LDGNHISLLNIGSKIESGKSTLSLFTKPIPNTKAHTKPLMNNIYNTAGQYEKKSTLTYYKISYLSKNQPDLAKPRHTLLLKRGFDVIVSLIVMVGLLSWLLPLLAILIKLNSKGPVFFIQKRVGAFGKIFNCYKLRTMVVNEQADIRQAETNDPRITGFGMFLRLSCLDELPQFFNVLIGNMSVVGPRPHMLEDCNEFSKIIRSYESRNLVKPGITGMAQVKGLRGKTNSFFDVTHRYKWDMFYVRNLSLKLDMRILKLTVTSTLANLISTSLAFHKKSPPKPNSFHFETKELLN
jgi:putative colanic acid biosynthesis UDP-glucose lipid carrier transferase